MIDSEKLWQYIFTTIKDKGRYFMILMYNGKEQSTIAVTVSYN